MIKSWANTWLASNRRVPRHLHQAVTERTNLLPSCQYVWESVFVVRALLFFQTLWSALVSPQQAETLKSDRQGIHIPATIKRTHTHTHIYQLNTKITSYKKLWSVTFRKIESPSQRNQLESIWRMKLMNFSFFTLGITWEDLFVCVC